jgi:O-antigen/teichoic acid export membrane protein
MENNPGILGLMRRLWASAYAIAAVGTVIRVGANIILLPLILRTLAPELQALWWVFLSLGALASLSDFGFGQVISRVYGFLWAGAEDVKEEGLTSAPQGKEPNLARLRVLNCTVRHLYFWVSVTASVLLALGGTWVLGKPINALAQPMQGWLAWGGYLTAISYSIFTGHWSLACIGVNRVRELHFAYTAGGVAYLAVAVTLLRLGYGLHALVAATLLRAVATWAITKHSYHQAVPTIAHLPEEVDFALLKRLWPNAKKFGLMAIAGYLVSQANMMIASHILPVEQMAAYGLSVQVVTFLVNFSYLWLSVKWPQITVLRTQGAIDSMSRLFARRLALVVFTFLMGACGLLLLGGPLLKLIGAKSNLLPPEQLLIYLAWAGLQILPVHFGQLTYTENVVPFYRLSIFTGVLCASLVVLLAPRFGIYGLLWIPLLVESTCSWWYVVIRGFAGQSLGIRDFFKAFLWQSR